MKITPQTIAAIAPHANPGLVPGLCSGINTWLAKFGLTKAIVVQHFLAQAAEESDGFRTLQEYASGAAYEGRHDLGNTQPGDGVRFKGRGIFMNTGRANYARAGHDMGLDLINHPELLLNPGVAVHAACLYWLEHNLTPLALADDLRGITHKINGGYNGLNVRAAYLQAAKKAISADLDVASSVAPPVGQAPLAPRPAAPVTPAKPAPSLSGWLASIFAPKTNGDNLMDTSKILNSLPHVGVFGVILYFVQGVLPQISAILPASANSSPIAYVLGLVFLYLLHLKNGKQIEQGIVNYAPIAENFVPDPQIKAMIDAAVKAATDALAQAPKA